MDFSGHHLIPADIAHKLIFPTLKQELQRKYPKHEWR